MSGYKVTSPAVSVDGMVSIVNSSTTALNDTDVFTGEWEDVSAYNSLTVAVKTDQNGTYSIQFSPDGTNQDSTLTRYYRTNQIEAPHRFTITRKYARVVFTNDSGSNQTYFRLQTILGDQGELNAPADSTLAQDFDATVVRPTDFKYEVAEGLRQGYTTWNKWGYNPDIDVGTETVWSVGGLFTPLSSAGTLEVVSSSTTDDRDPAGTGAQSIIIYGLDANYEEQTEVVTLNGTTAVTTTNSWLGVNRAAIYLSWSGGINAGDISITATTGGSDQAEIPAGEGSTQHAFFFVPAGHVGLMDWLWVNAVKTSGGSHPVITTKVWVTSLVSGSKYEVFRDSLDIQRDNHSDIRPSQPFVVGEKSLVDVQVTTDTNNTTVSARFSLITARLAAT